MLTTRLLILGAGVRALFLGELGSPTVVWSVVAVLGLVGAGMALGTRAFGRETS